ncbi:8662_t:CDS:2 [Funneliformis caledonium]|uniref:8662_t:CDS:1 n=1 Tax=Funneliformis caledonium TaxID=1117310 RepID=A0A9N9FSH5_9GLOM|nr:8662_t:CDS:2 [Funneliformis caledonium]
MRQKPFQITTTPKRRSVSRRSDEGRYHGRSSECQDHRSSERQNCRIYEHSQSPPYRHNRSSLDRFSQSPPLEHCGRSSGKSSEQNELTSIRNTLDYLVKEVKNLKANLQFSRSSQSSLRAVSVIPVPPGGYDSRHEVVQILSGFDNSLSIDHTQKWNDICDHVFKDIMPAVNQALTDPDPGPEGDEDEEDEEQRQKEYEERKQKEYEERRRKEYEEQMKKEKQRQKEEERRQKEEE